MPRREVNEAARRAGTLFLRYKRGVYGVCAAGELIFAGFLVSSHLIELCRVVMIVRAGDARKW